MILHSVHVINTYNLLQLALPKHFKQEMVVGGIHEKRHTEFINHTSVTEHLSNCDYKQNIFLKALAAYLQFTCNAM